MSTQRFSVSGSQLVDKVKELVREGNVRNVRIIHKERTLIDIPLTAGAGITMAAILAAPVVAVLATLAVLLTNCTVEIEKVESTPKE